MTGKAERERRSRRRRMLGLRFFPQGAKPLDRGPELIPGVRLAVLDVNTDVVARFLVREGFISQAELDADQQGRTHKRIDAAILEYIKISIRTNSATRCLRPLPPVVALKHEETESHSVRTDESRPPRRTRAR